MKNLPDTIIIRYDDIDIKYKRQKLDYFCYYRRAGQQFLIKANAEHEIWAAIKRLCELWLEKDKIFFEFDKRKKKMKLFLDAAEMLKKMSKNS